MAFAPFVPLRVMSSYSLLEGAVDPKAIARIAKERGFPAIGVCDRNGLYGAVPFAAACAAIPSPASSAPKTSPPTTAAHRPQ